MNYFAHGRLFLDNPFFLAGTAVPDWLSVADRPVRVRRRQAETMVDDADECLAALARGIVQHHVDDGWFHNTRAFAELSWTFTATIRDALPVDDGLRPSFLGHILVELLLDAVLIDDDPSGLHEYYRLLERAPGALVEHGVNRLAVRSTTRLAPLLPLFCRERFLWDYGDDGKLWVRLNQVMRRVRLPALPREFCRLLPAARAMVAGRKDELLSPAIAEPIAKAV